MGEHPSVERARRHFEHLLELGLAERIDRTLEEAELDEIGAKVVLEHVGYAGSFDKNSQEAYADAFRSVVKEISSEKWPAQWLD